MYAKKIYVTYHQGNGRDNPWLSAFDDIDAAIDDADEEGVKVAVYSLVSKHAPIITRGLKQS